MCDVIDKVENKKHSVAYYANYMVGYLEGRIEGRAERIAEKRTYIHATMKNLHITLDEALRILEISDAEWEEINKTIDEQSENEF